MIHVHGHLESEVESGSGKTSRVGKDGVGLFKCFVDDVFLIVRGGLYIRYGFYGWECFSVGYMG
jgi:hypothetical protein